MINRAERPFPTLEPPRNRPKPAPERPRPPNAEARPSSSTIAKEQVARDTAALEVARRRLEKMGETPIAYEKTWTLERVAQRTADRKREASEIAESASEMLVMQKRDNEAQLQEATRALEEAKKRGAWFWTTRPLQRRVATLTDRARELTTLLNIDRARRQREEWESKPQAQASK